VTDVAVDGPLLLGNVQQVDRAAVLRGLWTATPGAIIHNISVIRQHNRSLLLEKKSWNNRCSFNNPRQSKGQIDSTTVLTYAI